MRLVGLAAALMWGFRLNFIQKMLFLNYLRLFQLVICGICRVSSDSDRLTSCRQYSKHILGTPVLGYDLKSKNVTPLFLLHFCERIAYVFLLIFPGESSSLLRNSYVNFSYPPPPPMCRIRGFYTVVKLEGRILVFVTFTSLKKKRLNLSSLHQNNAERCRK